MFNKMFNHVSLLEKSLDASSLRQQVLAQNVANADTPGYKAERVDFEERFKLALDRETGFVGKRTRDKHIIIGEGGDALSVRPLVVKDNHYTMRMDGNNVDVDAQMVEQAKNTILMNTVITEMNSEFARLRMAIREGR